MENIVQVYLLQVHLEDGDFVNLAFDTIQEREECISDLKSEGIDTWIKSVDKIPVPESQLEIYVSE